MDNYRNSWSVVHLLRYMRRPMSSNFSLDYSTNKRHGVVLLKIFLFFITDKWNFVENFLITWSTVWRSVCWGRDYRRQRRADKSVAWLRFVVTSTALGSSMFRRRVTRGSLIWNSKMQFKIQKFRYQADFDLKLNENIIDQQDLYYKNLKKFLYGICTKNFVKYKELQSTFTIFCSAIL